MRRSRVILIMMSIIIVSILMMGCAAKNKTENVKISYTSKQFNDGKTVFTVIQNPNNGALISYSPNSGLKIIEVTDGDYIYAFKDMNRNGLLDPWEDWRNSNDIRAKSLASELTKEQIAGLMLFSSHERDIAAGLTDAQKQYLKNDNLRNILHAGPSNVRETVQWSNQMQAYVESLDSTAIPINMSTDPRSFASIKEYMNFKKGDLSLWPSNMGIAATFNLDIVKQYGQVISEEYRKMGITTLLGPQVELSTEPRWLRLDDTFGENPMHSYAISQTFVEALQSTYKNGKDIGWGETSINAMIKHFPGDGIGEGGRESHIYPGKFGVYPGSNLNEQLVPFIASLSLDTKTGKSAAVMTSYSIGIDKNGKPVFGIKAGSAYDKGKLDILRNELEYDSVVCTDWGVTKYFPNQMYTGEAWGAENLTVEQRHYEILKTDHDIFGGNNEVAPVLAAYEMWDKDYASGKQYIPASMRFEKSARRILKLFFNTRLFDNPYLVLEDSIASVGSDDKIKAGYNAQLDSIIMLKNSENIVSSVDDYSQAYKYKTVYIPSSIAHYFKSVFSDAYSAQGPTMDVEIAKKLFKNVITDTEIKNADGEIIGYKTPDLSNVDLIIVGMRTPDNGTMFSYAGYDLDHKKYYPLTLQYGTYSADNKFVRKHSVSGDTLPNGKQENRSYFGQKSRITNAYDLVAFQNAVKAAESVKKTTGKNIPVLVAIKAYGLVIPSEFEPKANAIVMGFSVSDEALFQVLLGGHSPKARLPLQIPADMLTVENQAEDVPHDMNPYIDSMGNFYDFGFGLNYQGIIK